MLCFSVFFVSSIFHVTLSGPVDAVGGHHDPHHGTHDSHQNTSNSHAHEHLHRDVHPDDRFNIKLSIYSGKPDPPSWVFPGDVKLDATKEKNILDRLVQVGHKPGLNNDGTLPAINGYRGITIDHLDANGTSIHKFAIPACTVKDLEWSLVIWTAPNSIVPLPTKKAVHDQIWSCTEPNETGTNGQNTAIASSQDTAATATV